MPTLVVRAVSSRRSAIIAAGWPQTRFNADGDTLFAKALESKLTLLEGGNTKSRSKKMLGPRAAIRLRSLREQIL
jgi:hypothetical protein